MCYAIYTHNFTGIVLKWVGAGKLSVRVEMRVEVFLPMNKTNLCFSFIQHTRQLQVPTAHTDYINRLSERILQNMTTTRTIQYLTCPRTTMVVLMLVNIRLNCPSLSTLKSLIQPLTPIPLDTGSCLRSKTTIPSEFTITIRKAGQD